MYEKKQLLLHLFKYLIEIFTVYKIDWLCVKYTYFRSLHEMRKSQLLDKSLLVC